jgi:ABC-type transporter Mla MlaB component
MAVLLQSSRYAAADRRRLAGELVDLDRDFVLDLSRVGGMDSTAFALLVDIIMKILRKQEQRGFVALNAPIELQRALAASVLGGCVRFAFQDL